MTVNLNLEGGVFKMTILLLQKALFTEELVQNKAVFLECLPFGRLKAILEFIFSKRYKDEVREKSRILRPARGRRTS